MKNKILVDRLCIEITCDRDDLETRRLASHIESISHNRIFTSFKTSTRNIIEVLKVFRGIDETNISTAPRPMQEYFWAEYNARIAVDHLMKYGPEDSGYVTPTLTLERHQQLARELSRHRDRYGFFYDTRTGKTPMSLAIMYDDLQAHPDHKWLVVCPLILIENAWLPDAAKFMPDIQVVNTHAKSKAKRLEAINSPGQIYITNTESFINYRQYFNGFHGCFVDESSDMKSNKSKVSHELVDFAQYVKKFYLLSGTPAPNGEHEYYMQLRAIDMFGIAPSFSQHMRDYFVNVSYNPQWPKWQIRMDLQEEHTALLRRYSLYVDKEDVLETPGRSFIPVPLELPKELKDQYNEVRKELNLEIDEDTNITVTSAAAKCNKLNQVTSGFIMDTEARVSNALGIEEHRQEVYRLSDYRYQALMELLAKHPDDQVIIWCNYREEFRRLKELLLYNSVEVHGGVNSEYKTEALQFFKSGKAQYLLANPASADKGLTLTNCHINVFFSLNYSYELWKQSIERIYGSKKIQPKHCLYYILLAKGTIDEVIYNDVLQNKKYASEAVLNHLKAGAI